MTDPDQLPALPQKRRGFICTKCGSSECRPDTLHREHPECDVCGYCGFAQDLDYNDVELQAYALTAIATERARADALEAALSDVLEMAQEHADHFAAAFAGYKPERHAYYARALATARALLEKKT